MKNTTKKEASRAVSRLKKEPLVRFAAPFFVLTILLIACQKQPAPPPPPSFSMDSLAQVFVKARLFEKASGSRQAKRDTLRTLLKEKNLSPDSIQSILNYFKAYPQAWVLFYKKVERLARPKPPVPRDKKNPATR